MVEQVFTIMKCRETVRLKGKTNILYMIMMIITVGIMETRHFCFCSHKNRR